MPLVVPTSKKDLKTAIFNAFKEQSNVTSGDPVSSYSALSVAISNAIDQYVATELYKIKIGLILPASYTAPSNVPPGNNGPLTPGVIIATFAQAPEEEKNNDEDQAFKAWKEDQPSMVPLNNIGLQNEIYRAFNDRTSEPATGDSDTAYRKIAETMGEAIAGYVTNEMNKIKFALIQPGAFTAAGPVVSAGSISAYEPGIPSGPFI